MGYPDKERRQFLAGFMFMKWQQGLTFTAAEAARISGYSLIDVFKLFKKFGIKSKEGGRYCLDEIYLDEGELPELILRHLSFEVISSVLTKMEEQERF